MNKAIENGSDGSQEPVFAERSELTQEVVSRRPDFLEKWALLICLGLLLILVSGAWFIRYPDLILADALLTGCTPPEKVISAQSGKLSSLLVTNNQQVKKGQIIGLVESSASASEIIDLRSRLDSILRRGTNRSREPVGYLFSQYYKHLGELQKSYNSISAARPSSTIQSLVAFKNEVDDWIGNYTIRAPRSGSLVFLLPIRQDQYISKDSLLGYVNPPDSNYYIEVKLSQKDLGVVDTGMKVQLQFDAYPYRESGFVPGRLSYISKASVNSSFPGTVSLDRGLVTNRGIALPYINGLRANALIITKEQSFLKRIYYSIVKFSSPLQDVLYP